MVVRNNQERQDSFLKYYGVNIFDLMPELAVFVYLV